MSKEVRIPVVVYSRDCGDGSTRVVICNDEAQLRKHEELDDEQWEKITSGYDPYEYGHVYASSITVTVKDDGSVALAKPASFSTDG